MRFCLSFFLLFLSLFATSQSVLTPFQATNGLFGYKNKKDKIIIKPAFSKALEFEKRYALVKQGEKWGLINERGLFVIPPSYDTLRSFTRVFLAGNRQLQPPLTGIKFSEEMHYGLLTLDNHFLQPIKFKKIKEKENDSFLLTAFNKWEIKKSNGDSLLTTLCDTLQIDSLPQGMALDTIPLEYDWRMPHKLGKTWGFIDSIGLMRISNRYEAVKPFHENVAAVKFNGGWGFINKKEAIIIQPNYEWVSDMENGLTIARKKGKYSIISLQAKELMKFEYDTIYRQSSGVFISRKGNKYGIIGKNGYEVLPPRFDKVFPQNDYHTIVKRGSLYGLMAENGSIVFPIQYDAILYEPQERNYILLTKGKIMSYKP
jgi:hypothetical protein